MKMIDLLDKDDKKDIKSFVKRMEIAGKMEKLEGQDMATLFTLLQLKAMYERYLKMREPIIDGFI